MKTTADNSEVVRLTDTLAAWGTQGFDHTLKREVLTLPPGTLPLQHATTQGGRALDGIMGLTVLRREGLGEVIRCRLGVFFTETLSGCNCADDPFTDNSYCEMELRIDRTSAEARFNLL